MTEEPSLLTLLEGAFASTRSAVALVGPGDLDRPTPCAEWTVHDVLRHVIGVIEGFRFTAAKQVGSPGEHAFGDDLGGALSTEPLAAYDRAVAATLAAWSAPGALDGDTPLPVGFSVPATAAAGINFFDTLVHGWDLRVALGADPELPADLARAALPIVRQIVSDDVRALVGFAPESRVGSDASPTHRLVAYLGRRP